MIILYTLSESNSICGKLRLETEELPEHGGVGFRDGQKLVDGGLHSHVEGAASPVLDGVDMIDVGNEAPVDPDEPLIELSGQLFKRLVYRVGISRQPHFRVLPFRFKVVDPPEIDDEHLFGREGDGQLGSFRVFHETIIAVEAKTRKINPRYYSLNLREKR